MGNRKQMLELLLEYQPSGADEKNSREKIIEFVKANPECFDNDFKSGHITGSALVTDRKREYVLLTHHRKLDRWLQFGGHSDSDPDVIKTGMREATEESGLKSLQFYPEHEGIFDVDVHTIPQRGEMLEHTHYDVRILLTGDISEPIVTSQESKELKWIKLREVKDYNQEPAFSRMIKKLSEI